MRAPLGIAVRRCLAFAVLLAGVACQSAEPNACARPEHANRGYRNVTGKIQSTARQVLFDSAYTVLAGRARELDAGSRAVRQRLARADIDPTETTFAKFSSDRQYGTMWLAATREGPLAAQVSAVTRRLEQTVAAAARLLPAKDMIAWRDELGRRIRDAVATAFFADPTYHAGFQAEHPDWNGAIDGMRGDEDFQDLVNSIGGDILTAVQSTLSAACATDN